MLRKIICHGYLAELVPEPIMIEAENAAEAISGLCAATGHALKPTISGGRHLLKVVGFESRDSLYEPTDVEELHVVPSFAGGKDGLFQILLGAVIIGVALWASGGTLLAAGALTGWGSVALFGATMLLGGMLQMLSPAPKTDVGLGSGDPEASKYLQSNRNTVKIGTRIPMLIGRFRVYGQFLSFNVDAKQVHNPNTYTPPPTVALGGVTYVTNSVGH